MYSIERRDSPQRRTNKIFLALVGLNKSEYLE